MTDALVEAVARAVCKANCPPSMGSAGVDCQVEGAWDMWAGEARAALQAIEAAGYRVVPVKATGGMVEAAEYARRENTDRYLDGSEVAHEDMLPAVWSAMLSAAPRAGEGV